MAHLALELSYAEDPKGYLNDLFQYGCINGMVSSLVRYSQTRAFYDEHYFEIEDIRERFETEGIQLHIKGDLKNFFAWLAFEEVARDFAQELGCWE